MEKHYYTAETLEAELREFEGRFGMPTEYFFELYERGQIPEGLTGHGAFVWADLYREVCRLRDRATGLAAPLLPAD